MVRRSSGNSKARWKSAAARRILALAGSPATIREAVEIVARHYLEGQLCPPTDLDALCEHLHITCIPSDNLPVSGELRRGQRGFDLYYSTALSHTRRRFTQAHEIGHAILANTGRGLPNTGEELERICDMLATELLMPRGVFENEVDGRLSVQQIVKLAAQFDTSITATAIRVAELCDVTVFEVKDSLVTWGYGFVKRGFHVSMIREAVESAMAGQAGENIVVIPSGTRAIRCRLEWTPLGRGRHAVFMATPFRG